VSTEAEIYRVLFETVNLPALRKYCNADPALFKNTTQTVPNSQIPDEDWHPVEGRATDSPWQQYNQLRQWEAGDREFVRNVRLEKMASAPIWEEVQAAASQPETAPMCPGGCGCRLGTDDADRFECGCDEGCCE
jgi:hypothetical protein